MRRRSALECSNGYYVTVVFMDSHRNGLEWAGPDRTGEVSCSHLSSSDLHQKIGVLLGIQIDIEIKIQRGSNHDSVALGETE
jgi:hypothetical protein